MTTYTAVYKRGRTRVTVKSVSEPPPVKLMRTAGGIRRFKRITLKKSTREVIIVATTKKRKKPVDTEELEELESLEDLEELDEEEDEDEDVEDDDEDEDEPEDEEEEDEDDEDEEPAPKRSKKSAKSTASKKTSAKSRKPGESRAAANGKVGTQEVAAHFGVDARSLRMVLRKHNIPKDDETQRYEWSSLKHPQVIKIGKLLKGGAVKKARDEGLKKLKSSKAAKSTTKAKASTKKRRRPVEDEDDE